MKNTGHRDQLQHFRQTRTRPRSRQFATVAIACLCLLVLPSKAAPKSALPNIIIIYADDLGYGDLSCYNAKCAYQTPRLDRMAAEGIRFTDAHSPSTICYLDHPGSGGNRYDEAPLKRYALPESAPGAPGQLFDLEQDPGETTNLYFTEQAKRLELQALLERLKSSGRSAPRNRVPIGIDNIPRIKL